MVILPQPTLYANWQDWAARLLDALQQEQDNLLIPEIVEAKLPAPGGINKWKLLVVLDGANPGLRLSDGTAWRPVVLLT